MKLRFLIPLILFVVVCAILGRGLSLHPNTIPSPLIGKPLPTFSLPTLSSTKTFNSEELPGKVSLINVWATWCYACAMEHDFLLTLSKDKHIVLYGLNYKDNPTTARLWLKKHGNPYARVALDPSGDTAINWGVYGTPETFIIDKKGRVRHKYVGPLTEEAWENQVKAIVIALEGEPS